MPKTGRSLVGMVAGFKPEWRPASYRNPHAPAEIAAGRSRDDHFRREGGTRGEPAHLPIRQACPAAVVKLSDPVDAPPLYAAR